MVWEDGEGWERKRAMRRRRRRRRRRGDYGRNRRLIIAVWGSSAWAGSGCGFLPPAEGKSRRAGLCLSSCWVGWGIPSRLKDEICVTVVSFSNLFS